MEQEPKPYRAPAFTVPAGVRRGLWIGGIVLSVIIGLILLFGVVMYVTKGSFLKSTVENYAARTLDRAVEIDGGFMLYPRPHIRLYAENIRVSNPDWAEADDFFRAEKLDVEINLWRLLGGGLTFNKFFLDRGALELERGPDDLRTWMFSDQPSEDPLTIPIIREGKISQSGLRYIDKASDFALTARIGDIVADQDGRRAPLVIEGEGTLRRDPFTLEARIEAPDSFFRHDRSDISLFAKAARSELRVSGSLASPSTLQDADLKVTLKGRSLDAPFALIGVVVPATRPYNLQSQLTIDDSAWHFNSLSGKIGDSDMGGQLIIRSIANDRLFLEADLKSKVLDILDVGPLIGISPQALDEKGGDGAIKIAADKTPRVLPNASLAIDALDRFDARVKYRADSVRAPDLPLENVQLDFTLDDRILSFDPLAINLAKGRVEAKIVINARKLPVVTRYNVAMRDMQLASFVRSAGLSDKNAKGMLRGRIDLVGTGDNVHQSLATSNGRIAIIIPNGQFNVFAAQLAELDAGNVLRRILTDKKDKAMVIRCGLVGFTVKDGIAEADPIIIDMDKTKMNTTGKISFKDESLDLKFQALSKDFSLLSGQSPIYIGGHFADLKVNPVSGQLLARGGIAAALGIVATPFAAILAFVDVGGTKDAACEPLLQGLPADAEKAARDAQQKKNK